MKTHLTKRIHLTQETYLTEKTHLTKKTHLNQEDLLNWGNLLNQEDRPNQEGLLNQEAPPNQKDPLNREYVFNQAPQYPLSQKYLLNQEDPLNQEYSLNQEDLLHQEDPLNQEYALNQEYTLNQEDLFKQEDLLNPTGFTQYACSLYFWKQPTLVYKIHNSRVTTIATQPQLTSFFEGGSEFAEFFKVDFEVLFIFTDHYTVSCRIISNKKWMSQQGQKQDHADIKVQQKDAFKQWWQVFNSKIIVIVKATWVKV